jgi:hypothetical protein
MASNLYALNACKDLLNIDITDTVDDEILNRFGAVANQHMDNILKQHDERIPLKVPSILADVKMAANYYVCSLFRGKRGDNDTAKFWKEMFTELINGVIEERSIEGLPYDVQRFNDRYRQEDVYRLW